MIHLLKGGHYQVKDPDAEAHRRTSRPKGLYLGEENSSEGEHPDLVHAQDQTRYSRR